MDGGGMGECVGEQAVEVEEESAFACGPFGPMRPTHSPGWMEKEMPRRASVPSG